MDLNRKKLRRRAFLKAASGVVAAPLFVPASALGRAGRPAPSERITLGFIGLGIMGLRHVNGFKYEADCQLTAVCDVDAVRRREAARVVDEHYGDPGGCAQYHNFEDMLGRRDLDTVCISLPDHWHALASIPAVRAGKDVYGEKPLALTVAEGRRMVREVRRHGCIWQMGSWKRSTSQFRLACELVRNGHIGRLERVEVGLAPAPTTGAHPPMPVPPHFDYERWLGPAPWAPYTEQRCHWNFRWIFDHSGGQVTDQGAHDVDIAQWGMGTDATGPAEVEGRGEFPRGGLWDVATRYAFTCRYADGPPLYIGSLDRYRGGTRFMGDAGWIQVSHGGIDARPKSLLREKFGPDDVRLYHTPVNHRQGHRRNFLDCVRTRREPITPIEVGHRSVTICHLGNIAMRLGRPIRWDPAREAILGDPGANQMLDVSGREPYVL